MQTIYESNTLRALITGSGGNIGSACVDEAITRSFDIETIQHDDIDMRNMRDLDRFAKAMGRFDIVLMCHGYQRLATFTTLRPMVPGGYLFSLKMQIGWNAAAVGPNDLNGSVDFQDGTTVVKTTKWVRSKSEASGYQYGVAESYDFWFIATVTNGQNLRLSCSSQFAGKRRTLPLRSGKDSPPADPRRLAGIYCIQIGRDSRIFV